MSAHAVSLHPAVAFNGVGVCLDRTTILHDITFVVKPGSWVAVIGPNGAGKSTLLHAACGIVSLTGSVMFGESDSADLTRRERAAQVALVAQTPVIPDGMTVREYALLGRTPHRSPLGAEGPADHSVVQRVLGQLDLAQLANRKMTSLSGGERQRAVVARALSQQSAVLLLDEPTAALDIGHQVDVLDLVDQLRRELGLTVITTLHDLTMAGRYPDQIVLLSQGRVVACGTPSEVLTEDTLSSYYATPVRVLHDESGLVVVPARRTRPMH